MKPSFYNFYKIENGVVLIYNSASGNCIIIDEAELSSFMEASMTKDTCEHLKKMGFLVDEQTNELNQLIHNAYDHLSSSQKDKYRILTTTACNAKCPYCYEKGVEVISMTKNIADKVVEFVLDKSKNKKSVEIEWFGGEPLVNKDIITYIIDKIHELKPKHLKYESSIITNGYLIDPSLIETMIRKWIIKRVQITLDGTSEIYEKIKQLGVGSFEKVLNNINELSKYDIEIDVRLNFDENNLNHQLELIKYLSTLKLSKKIFVYPAKINNENRSDNFALENETISMYNALHTYGFLKGKKLLPKTMKSPCAASKKDYFTIHASGDLFKCDRKLLKGNTIGSVFNYQEEIRDTSEWETIIPETKCKVCKMYPLCWGGCIYERIKHLDRCYITEKIIDNNLGLILADYLKVNNNG